MIQDFSLNIKSAFNSFDFKFFDEPDFDTVERIETYCLNNINASTQHTHNNSTCKSSQLVYFKNYSRHYVSSSEVVQVSTEWVEQLETYFGKYLPQFFYSLLAPITLFIIFSQVNLKASIILLICVPLIPISIVAVQKFAKKLLSNYWSVYTGLGDSFLENL